MFHDADALRLCGKPLVIGRSRLADLASLRLGGEPIPTLDDLFALVAGRVPLLLEIKVDEDISRWAPALAAALADYRGPFGIMSFDPRIPRLLKANFPEVRRGLVVGADLSSFRRRLALSLASPEFVAVARTAVAQSWVQSLRRLMPVYSWTIGTPEQRAQAEVHADALIWEADGRP